MKALVIAVIAMFICIAAILVFAMNPSLLRNLMGLGSSSSVLTTVYTVKNMSSIDVEMRGGSLTIVVSNTLPYRVEANTGCSVSVSGLKHLEIVIEGSSCRVVVEAPPHLNYVTLYARKGSIEIDGLSLDTLAATLISSSSTLNGVLIKQSLYLYLFSSRAELNGVEMARGSSGKIELFSSALKADFSDRVRALLDACMSSVSNNGCTSGPLLRVLARTSSVVLSCPRT